MDFNQVNSEDFYKKSNKKIFTYLKNLCTIKNIFVIIFFTTLLIIVGVKNKKKESQIRKKNNSNSEYFDLLIEKEMELNNQKRIFKNYNIDLDNIDTKIEELKEKNKTLIAEINELKTKNDEQKLKKAEVEDENNLLKSSKTQILEQQTNKTTEFDTHGAIEKVVLNPFGKLKRVISIKNHKGEDLISSILASTVAKFCKKENFEIFLRNKGYRDFTNKLKKQEEERKRRKERKKITEENDFLIFKLEKNLIKKKNELIEKYSKP